MAQLGVKDQGQNRHQVPLPARTLLQTDRQIDEDRLKGRCVGRLSRLGREVEFKELPVSQLVVMQFLPISKVLITFTSLIMAEAATINFWNIRISH